MFRKIGFGAAAALTLGMLAVGCSEDGDTFVSGGGVTRPDSFPGSQVDVNNVADDARALTPAGEAFRSGELFWNVSNNEAILVFVTKNEQANTFALYASHFDGTSYTKPVQIRGNDSDSADRAIEDATKEPIGYKVLFLNPTGNADSDAADRVGDAIIFFTREDTLLPTAATTEENPNVRAWAAYFHRADRNATAANGVIRGFQTNASVIDTDNQFTGADDPDVAQFGFASDSLEFTHSFTDKTDGVASGQPTTYVYLWYAKNTGSATALAPAIRVVPFDITQTGNGFPASSSGSNLANVGVTVAANKGADVGTNPVVVHNNIILWSSTDVNTDNEDVVTASVLPKTATGGSAVNVLLGSDLTANTNDQTLMPLARDVYFEDHKVDGLYAFFRESGFSNGTSGRSADSDVMVSFLPNVASPTRQISEVDLFKNDLGTGVSGTNGGVSSLVGTRINRSGDFITVLMIQENSNSNTAGIQYSDVLVANVVQVRKIGTTASTRDLTNAVGTPTVAPSLGFPAPTAAPVQADVQKVQFQQELAQGQAPKNGGTDIADRGCSFQGNANRINFLYQQLDNQTGASADDLRLLVNGIRVTPGANDTTAPTFTMVSTSQTVLETVDITYLGGAGNTISAIAIDAGDDSRNAGTGGTAGTPTDASGRPLVFYISNETDSDFVTQNNPTGSFIELRLFASDTTGTPTIISTNPSTSTLDAFEVGTLLGAVSVPTNADTTANPSWVGNRAHVFWTEETTDFSARSLATRSYDLSKSETTTTTTTFGERFTPALTAGPVFIDNPDDRPLLAGTAKFAGFPGASQGLAGGTGFDGFSIVRGVETVGVFFDEDYRLYYQQTSGTANDWYKEAGVADPQLVDNESDRLVLDYEITSPPECDNLRGTQAIFMKATDAGTDYPRIQVRVMN